MKQSSSYFKRNALDSLRGKWVIAVVALLLASLLGGLTSGGSFSINFNTSGSDTGDSDSESIESFEELVASLEKMFESPAVKVAFFTGLAFSLLFALAKYVIGSCVEVGYGKFNLDLVDRKNPELGSLFRYFSSFKKNFMTRLLRDVYVFLWSLLFIIPGIMKSYSYAMVSYLRAENPEMGADEAITKSKELMYGHRADLFVLNLSFIGWYLLALLTCGIAFPVVSTYQQAAQADFFRELTGTRPAPTEGGFGVPPYGNPYGQGTPYGQPYGNPYGQGTPYGQPYGNPYGQGTPYGNPYAQGTPTPTPTPEVPAETPAEAPIEVPAETPVAEEASVKDNGFELPTLPDLPDVSEITVDPDSKDD